MLHQTQDFHRHMLNLWFLLAETGAAAMKR
jgi:hypothetical protein